MDDTLATGLTPQERMEALWDLTAPETVFQMGIPPNRVDVLTGIDLAATTPPPKPMPGGYQQVESDRQDVQEARAAVQKQMAQLRIEEVTEAWVQVVAVMNYRLDCRVTDAGGASTWEFVVWHRLDGQWQLQSAKRL